MRTALPAHVIAIAFAAGSGCGRKESAPAKGSGAAPGAATISTTAGSAAVQVPVPYGIVPCAIDGPPLAIKEGSFSDVIRSIAAGPGALYLIDNAGAVRRYKLGGAAPAPCTLSIDPAFGTGGVLALPGKGRALTTDAKGTLYASAEEHALVRISSAGAIDLTCSPTGFTSEDITASPDGSYVLMEDFYGEWKKVTIAGTECAAEPWKPPFPTQFTPSLDFVGGRLILVSKAEISKAYTVHALRADATLDVELRTSTDLGDDNHICESAGAFPCGVGVCVVDNNCRALHQWTQEGAYVQKRSLYDGFPASPWVERVVARDGVAYLAVALDAEPDGYTGAVYRVQGL